MSTRIYTVEEIQSDLFIPDCGLKTKFAVAHGCKGASGELARFAAKRFHAGDFEWLVLTGGVRVFDPLTFAALMRFNLSEALAKAWDFAAIQKEADYMKAVVLRHGVPAARIFCEDVQGRGARSKHTGQNVENLLSMPELKDDLYSENAVMVLGHAYQTRRLAGTWRKKMPEGFHIATRSCFPYGFTRENWSGVWGVEQLIQGEMAKIDAQNPNALLYTTNDVVYFDQSNEV